MLWVKSRNCQVFAPKLDTTAKLFDQYLTCPSEREQNLKKILGNKLQGCQILIDSNEFFKQDINKDSFIQNISQIMALPLESVSLTPIDYNGKLFHPKAYALIEDIIPNSTTSNGFAIITSGNFTKSGMAGNIEMGS